MKQTQFFWDTILNEVRAADHVVEVGTGAGFGTIEFALRTGELGKVTAFESDGPAYASLQTNLASQKISASVRVLRSTVGTTERRHDRLDQVFVHSLVDILKIDAAGQEEAVLRSASGLLRDPHRRPRAVFVQLYPHLWKTPDTEMAAENLCQWLRHCGYNLHCLAKDVFSIQNALSEEIVIAYSGQRKRKTVYS